MDEAGKYHAESGKGQIHVLSQMQYINMKNNGCPKTI